MRLKSITTILLLLTLFALPAANGHAAAQVAAGANHTVGLKSDGTVIAIGRNDSGQCDVASWTDIVQVAAGGTHTVGLKADHTVVAVGSNDSGQCDVASWTDIEQIAAGGNHTVGLKSDGTVVAVGENGSGQINTGGWTGITQVSAGASHTLGLATGGTVVAVGDNSKGQLNVGGWTGITQVSAGGLHSVGRKTDGTAVAVGWDLYGQCDVSGWTGIAQVSAGGIFTVGLKSYGMVLVTDGSDLSSWTDITQVAAGTYHILSMKSDGTVAASGGNNYGECDVGSWTGIEQVAAGGLHGVGLKADGTVIAVVENSDGQCDVSEWTAIEQVAAGANHTVGLEMDGTVVAVGDNGVYGQCNVTGIEWSGITQIAAGGLHTVGLKTGGSVVAVGDDSFDQCQVSSWTGILQVAAGGNHTVGLETGGTAVATGDTVYGQCNVDSWSGLEQVAAGGNHTVGLKTDGTAVAEGANDYGQCDVDVSGSEWTGILQIAAGGEHTVGLKTDGTVIAIGRKDSGQCDVASWTDIVQVAAGSEHTIGLKLDGTVIAVGNNTDSRCNLHNWNLLNIDFGDALDPAYPTLLASDGARHKIVPGYCLGNGVSGDPDGRSEMNDADGYDDGVLWGAQVMRCAVVPITITASGDGYIDAWIDFNADGDWADAGEQIFTTQPVAAGANNLNVPVPCDMALSQTYARFRFSSSGGLSYTGLAPDGEVEDYVLNGTEFDFNGDGMSDILWRNTSTGLTDFWFIDGVTKIGYAKLGTVATVWKIEGVGDFDGDEHPDILWRNTSTGDIVISIQDGPAIASSTTVFKKVSTDWRIFGVMDFDGDGKADILWRYMNFADPTNAGKIYLTLMDVFEVRQAGFIGGKVASDWEVQGAGDFDGDGKADVAWRNMNFADATYGGKVCIWLLNGLVLKSSVVLSTSVASAWNIQGVGDFDEDAKSDILWRHTDGSIPAEAGKMIIWFMNGTVLRKSSYVRDSGNVVLQTSLVWGVAALGDYDNDGMSDMLFRRTDTGAVLNYLMNGNIVDSYGVLGARAVSEWAIVK